MPDQDQIRAFDEISTKFAEARKSLGKVVFGQEEVIDLTLATLAAGGHGLLVGAPGLAKTLLVTSLADLLGLSEKRVQFTPDLMPGDVLGSEVLEETADGKREFRFIPGPVFCQLLMADEITAPARAHSPHCCRQCRNIMSLSPAPVMICLCRFMYSQPRTRLNRKEPIRSRKRTRPVFAADQCQLS